MPSAAAIAVLPTPTAREVTPTIRPVGWERARPVSSAGTQPGRAAGLSRPAARPARLRSRGGHDPSGPAPGASEAGDVADQRWGPAATAGLGPGGGAVRGGPGWSWPRGRRAAGRGR